MRSWFHPLARQCNPRIGTRAFCVRSGHVVHLVPPPNDGLRDVVLVTQRAETRRAEHEVLTCSGFESQPTSRKHAQKMPAGKQQHAAIQCAYSAHHTIGARAYLIQRLPFRTTIAEQFPLWTGLPNLTGSQTLVFAVVPLDQIGIDLGRSAETGQFASARGPL
jgi:hypothetical protein